MAGPGVPVSSLIRRQHGGALFLRYLSRLHPAAPLPFGLHLPRHLSTDQFRRGPGIVSLLPPYDGELCGAGGFGVELVDDDTWKVTSALAHSSRPPKTGGWQPKNEECKMNDDCRGVCDEGEGNSFDFDEIEELRLRKKLFYKLDMGSMEIEECSISLFRRQKSKSKKKKLPEDLAPSREKQVSRKRELSKPSQLMDSRCEATGISPLIPAEGKKKRERIPTFSQLTDPYHLPFCLDLFISKGSVRACIIHRATSKVVSVAHSISKDMKFDLTSRRDAAACAAVGTALAQRALSDDIHNVVYSPRKGEKIEGKLQILLQSIMDCGIDVKVKIKRRKPLKGCDFSFPLSTRY
ncbi:unnamed protein product [Spirodela intermedia]|uniref:Uncharacterized protein n=1 Tax=Spirodela intermedia TaxID=51605 RepID=A0A7I8JWK9_SPIIN|nr:unnamed protein product [Spirodela intermedia]